MIADAVAAPGGGSAETGEYRAIALVSAAHFVNHYQNLVLPPLFPLLAVALDVSFVQLGFALTVASVVSVAAQLPVGQLVDRIGSRRMLVVATIVSGLAFVGFGISPTYACLLAAMALLGLGNSIFHPADYAILAAKVPPARLGRAFSVHTFAGFLGNAVAPMTMLAVAAVFGLGTALIAAGAVALAVALPLAMMRRVDSRIVPAAISGGASERGGMTAVLTPTIIGLTGFFALMSLSGSGIGSFSVVALTAGYDTPLATANLALTAYLALQAVGVLAGGLIADMTRRHAEVAALGYAVNALIVLAIGTVAMGNAALITAMAAAGLLSGLIMPSRDMLVRAAAPAGAIGRTFGIVTSGFSIGGMIGPLMFGFVLDHGMPRWVFGISVVLMIATTAAALIGDRHMARRRMAAAVAAE